MKSWLAIGVPLILLVMMGYVGCQWDRARSRALEAEDRAVALELEKAGLEQALSVKPTTIVELVDRIVPREVVKLVENKVFIPVTSIKIETKEVPVVIPCGDDNTFSTSVQVKGGFFLGTTPLGKPYWNRELLVFIRGLDEPIDFSQDPGIQLALSDEITKLIANAAKEPSRWRVAPRPVGQWRMGLTLGVGVCQPVLPMDRTNVCGAFLWGLQL